MVRNIDIQGIAREADPIAENPRPARVVELDAITTLGRLQIALAGNQVIAHLDIADLLDPQAKQAVGNGAADHLGPMRTGLDINTRMLPFKAAARIRDDQALQHDIAGPHPDDIALQPPADRRPLHAPERQRLVDQQVFFIAPALDQNDIARSRSLDGCHNRLPRRDPPLGRSNRPGSDPCQQQ
jgi:hypothetical protein